MDRIKLQFYYEKAKQNYIQVTSAIELNLSPRSIAGSCNVVTMSF